MSKRRMIFTSAAAVLALVVAACSNGGDDAGQASANEPATCKPVGDRNTATATVNMTLGEWFVKPDPPSVPAGSVGLSVHDTGDEAHELVIVKGVGPNELPRKKDGSLDEDKLPAGALVGEIEEFAAGTTCTGVFTLTPGEYTLLCNVVEKKTNGEHESHLKEGMVTTLTVT